MRDKLTDRWKTLFDLIVLTGLPLIAWAMVSIIELQQADAEDGVELEAIEKRLEKNDADHAEIKGELRGVEVQLEKARGEQRVSRQIECAILHEVKPGAPCPAVTDTD